MNRKLQMTNFINGSPFQDDSVINVFRLNSKEKQKTSSDARMLMDSNSMLIYKRKHSVKADSSNEFLHHENNNEPKADPAIYILKSVGKGKGKKKKKNTQVMESRKLGNLNHPKDDDFFYESDDEGNELREYPKSRLKAKHKVKFLKKDPSNIKTIVLEETSNKS